MDALLFLMEEVDAYQVGEWRGGEGGMNAVCVSGGWVGGWGRTGMSASYWLVAGRWGTLAALIAGISRWQQT